MNQSENKPYGSPTFKILMLVCGIAGIFIFGRAASDINRITQEQARNPAPVVAAQPVEPAAPPPYAPPGARRINGDNRFGCIDREYFERLVKMKAQGDDAAVTDGIRAGFISGQCVSFQAGEPVFLDEHSWGLIRIRPAGKQTSYWTFLEAAT